MHNSRRKEICFKSDFFSSAIVCKYFLNNLTASFFNLKISLFLLIHKTYAMILTDSFLLWGSLALSLLITVGFFFATRGSLIFESKKNLYLSLLCIFIISYPVSEFILKLPSKTVIVIESSDSARSFSHKDNIVYGNNVVKTHNGEDISIKGLGLKAGKLYAINQASTDMLFYPVSYTAAEGIFLFNKDKKTVLPKSILLTTGQYAELEKMPDFWFSKPQNYIETGNGLIKQLWISIFNIEDIRWGVLPQKKDSLVVINNDHCRYVERSKGKESLMVPQVEKLRTNVHS